MKITITPYNPEWSKKFEELKRELGAILKNTDPIIEHIGSTSVPGLAAKPIIDIQVGLPSESYFDYVVKQMDGYPYIYYEVFNSSMPNRRLFVRLKNKNAANLFPNIFTDLENIPHEEINRYRMAHVHVWVYGAPDWVRHIAFRDYLKTFPDIKSEYENLKKELSKKTWQDGMEYNDGKNAFIKRVQKEAMKWYNQI